jgi:hypothetical protein
MRSDVRPPFSGNTQGPGPRREQLLRLEVNIPDRRTQPCRGPGTKSRGRGGEEFTLRVTRLNSPILVCKLVIVSVRSTLQANGQSSCGKTRLLPLNPKSEVLFKTVSRPILQLSGLSPLPLSSAFVH